MQVEVVVEAWVLLEEVAVVVPLQLEVW